MLAGEVGTVSEPDGEALRSQRIAQLDAIDIVCDGLSTYLRVLRRQAAVLVAERLSGRILESVGVNAVEVQAMFVCDFFERARIGGAVPREMQRHARCCARQLVDGGAIVNFFKHVARFTDAGKARKARAAGARTPAGQGHSKAGGLCGERFDIAAASLQYTCQGIVIGLQLGERAGVLLTDEIVGNEVSHDVSV